MFMKTRSIFFCGCLFFLMFNQVSSAVEPEKAEIRFSTRKYPRLTFSRHSYVNLGVRVEKLLSSAFFTTRARMIVPPKIADAVIDVRIKMPVSYDPQGIEGFSGWRELAEVVLNFLNCGSRKIQKEENVILLHWAEGKARNLQQRPISTSICWDEKSNEGQGTLEDLRRTLEDQNNFPILIEEPVHGFLTWSLPFVRGDRNNQFRALEKQIGLKAEICRKKIECIEIFEKLKTD